MGACRVMHELKQKMDSNPKIVEDKKKTSPKTTDTVKRPYKHNGTDLWDRSRTFKIDCKRFYRSQRNLTTVCGL